VHDHTAVPALVESRYGLSPLTKRDKWAGGNNLDTLFSLSQARGNTPQKVEPAVMSEAAPKEGTGLLSDLQRELVESAALLAKHDGTLGPLRDCTLTTMSQADAAIYLQQVLRQLGI